MDLGLDGRPALVTGATAGIGRGIALALAGEGAHLVVVGRRKAHLDDVAAECRERGAGEVHTVEADMMDPDGPALAARSALDRLGAVEILVNCMGATRWVDLTTGDGVWDDTMTLNWNRHRQLTELVLPDMRRRRWGRVVNVTGLNETKGLNAAIVAKAATHAWAKGLSDLVAADGITVNCIGPGRINSEQLGRLYTDEQRDEAARRDIPVGRFGEPAELADLAVFLASPRASYITGAVIPVDGGARRYMF